jgi:hypothetical protein
MTLHPRSPADLLLAPVAAGVDANLRPLRDRDYPQIELELALALDLPAAQTRDGRAGQVLRAALREVDPHGWEAALTEDHSRLRLTGGSVSLELGLGTTLTSYIEAGTV